MCVIPLDSFEKHMLIVPLKGDLQQYLDQPLLEREGQLIMTQILVALEYMHERNFTHRDLKPGVSTAHYRDGDLGMY